MRFAFYGRVSTEDQQDPASSRGWQMSRSEALIAPHGGEVVEEFFDIGQSSRSPGRAGPRRSPSWAPCSGPTGGSRRSSSASRPVPSTGTNSA